MTDNVSPKSPACKLHGSCVLHAGHDGRCMGRSMTTGGLYPILVHDVLVHECSCGVSYTAETWRALPLVGYTPATEDHEGPLLELRNCTACASTRARGVPTLRYLVRSINAELRERRSQLCPDCAEDCEARHGKAGSP